MGLLSMDWFYNVHFASLKWHLWTGLITLIHLNSFLHVGAIEYI
jgi:hypothetical protein